MPVDISKPIFSCSCKLHATSKNLLTSHTHVKVTEETYTEAHLKLHLRNREVLIIQYLQTKRTRKIG